MRFSSSVLLVQLSSACPFLSARAALRASPNLEREALCLPKLHTPRSEAALCCTSQVAKALLTHAKVLRQGEPPKAPPVAPSLLALAQTCALVASQTMTKAICRSECCA